MQKAHNTADIHSTSEVRSPEGVVARGTRVSGYLFWYVLTVVLQQGLPQLVLFPLCLHLMGSEGFGKFIYALGLVRIVDVAPTRGLRNTLYRNLAGLADERSDVLVRTAFVLSVGLVSGLSLLAILACFGAWVSGAAGSEVALWTAILILPIAAQNLVLVTTTDLPVKRRFAQNALWQSLGGVLAFLALPGLFLLGWTGLPIGYALGHLAALTVLLHARRKTLIGKPQFDKGMAKKATTLWAALSISALLFGSGPYILRTLLGSFGSYEMVSVFYASAAAVQLIAMPVNSLGGFGLQILSAHASMRSLSPRLLKWYSVAAIIGAAGLYALMRWTAPWIAHRLYPAIANGTLEPISIMAPGIALSVLHSAAKPFVINFSPRRVIVTIGIVTAVTYLSSALLLIPAWGLVGAAWAYSIGTGVAGLTWFAFLLTAIFRLGSAAPGAASLDELDVD